MELEVSAEHSMPERLAEMEAQEVVEAAVLMISTSEGRVMTILALAG